MLRQLSLEFRESSGVGTLIEDLSAVCFTPDQSLWLASDESMTLERLRWREERFTDHESFDLAALLDLPAGATGEIDVEGLTVGGHYLWVCGSHSRKLKKPKPDRPDADNIRRLRGEEVKTEPNRYLLARIPFVNGKLFQSCPDPKRPGEQLTAAMLKAGEDGNALLEAIADDPHLGPYVLAGLPGKANGFDVEGLEVAGDQIFLGLRGPVLLEWAVILELDVKRKGNDRLALKKIGADSRTYRKHFVNLKGLGVRDLCFVGDDLLIMAGPTMFLDGPVKVFRLRDALHLADNTLHRPDYLFDLPFGDGEEHPEGMTLVTRLVEHPSVLVVYDAPRAERRVSPSTVLADVFAVPGGP